MAKRKRAKRFKLQRSWTELLTTVSTPLLLVDANRRVAFANQPLGDWIGLPLDEIIGRLVEYHSEPTDEDTERRAGILTELCPPPAALAGVRTRGTLSCLSRDGRLRHRRGEFLPLEVAETFAVLAILEPRDLAPEEVAGSLSVVTGADSLHRQLRQLRRDQAKRYSVASLVGESSAMRQIRAQVAAAARSRAHVLISGRRGSGRSHIAKAIHYASSARDSTPLVTLDCQLLNDEQLRRGLDSLRRGESSMVPTLLLLEIGQLDAIFQNLLAKLLRPRERECQVLATSECDSQEPGPIDGELRALISTMTIEPPPLATRAEDLPLLVQYFLEEANVDSTRQVGSVSQEVIERLALYHWPGEIAELREVIHGAHANCSGHELQVANLPMVVHHAAQAAQFAELPTEVIELDEFLRGIERELVLRAMEQSQGNKALAARMLGMTRPRLYRRLVQLGLPSGGDEAENQPEQEPTDDGS
ncbi:MAG: sigma 54-interacting transcriptional regulator [Pirellulales bacterium]